MKKIKLLKANFFGIENGWQEEYSRVKGTELNRYDNGFK